MVESEHRLGLHRSLARIYLQAMRKEVKNGLLASDEERLAAQETTAWLMSFADVTDDDGPLVHGWAVFAAFLAGAKWQREQTG
jgi:hypothetical protein